MKVWFCRDADGECSVWNAMYDSPSFITYHEGEVGIWDAPFYSNPLSVTKTTVCTLEIFGKGFHGVRKGQCKALDLLGTEPVNAESD